MFVLKEVLRFQLITVRLIAQSESHISFQKCYALRQLTLTTVRPFGAYLYGFRESTFIAILSFQPSSSAFCHGVSVDGSRNLTSTPATKHCQEGVGQECDHVWGERRGEEGAGDEDDTPESA